VRLRHPGCSGGAAGRRAAGDRDQPDADHRAVHRAKDLKREDAARRCAGEA
jgi:hypothetical protein